MSHWWLHNLHTESDPIYWYVISFAGSRGIYVKLLEKTTSTGFTTTLTIANCKCHCYRCVQCFWDTFRWVWGRGLRKKVTELVSKIKRGTKVSFPVFIPLLPPPTCFFPLPLSFPLLFFLGWWFHSVTIPGSKMCNFGSFHLSVAQTLLVSLQHSWHWLLRPLSLWSQSRSRFPATANHHLVAVAGGWQAVEGGGWRTP